LEESTASISSQKMQAKGKFVQPHTMKAYIGGREVHLSFSTKVLGGYELLENWCCMFWNNGNVTIKSAIYSIP
jgi:hypothetical protein